ncbi:MULTISPECIES: transketolase [Microbacterium]|uniref:transketolase n=1 Tax=Microbacterium TaxID=33882 RepID=UPI00277E0436|nr:MULTISPECIES: transketolase [Microbacterium]MDQ1082521.1 transketolase [Microbacterium sp. SORGH_AS_0344]MDQ1168707.1 transketolase [Microbacterium proteolyticum]
MLTTDTRQVEQWRELTSAVAGADAVERDALLTDRAKATRREIIKMIDKAGQGHIGGDLSVTDILTVLYNAVLRIDPATPDLEGRDRFILSKGHCAAALYVTLASAGYFPASALSTFMDADSALNGHPNRNKVPGVETNTGPLGHGLPVAVGQALAAKLAGNGARVFAVMGDGEMQEGSNWEALMTAAHYGLDNLTAIVDRNRLQQGARTEDTSSLDPLDEKLLAFGFELRSVDGHDYDQLLGAFAPSSTGKPVAVIANTIKGKGVSFIEDRVEWHHKVPSAEQVALAMEELA